MIDGEGTITITSRKMSGLEHRYFYVALRVSSTNHAVLEHLRERWGGTIFSSGNPKQGQLQGYALAWGPRALVTPTEAVLPFLVIKRPQALIALEYARLTDTSSQRNGKTERNGRRGGRQSLSEREWGYRNYLAWLVRHYNALSRSGERSFAAAWGATRS